MKIEAPENLNLLASKSMKLEAKHTDEFRANREAYYAQVADEFKSGMRVLWIHTFERNKPIYREGVVEGDIHPFGKVLVRWHVGSTVHKVDGSNLYLLDLLQEKNLTQSDQINADHLATGAGKSMGSGHPDLMSVILWLERGCDPKEAANELRALLTRFGDIASSPSSSLPVKITAGVL